MTMPTACQSLADKVAELEQERNALQLELQDADTGQKAAIAMRIKALNKQISVTRDQLVTCLTGTPPPRPLEAVFDATATVTTTNGHAPGPYESPIRVVLVFSGDRRFVAIRSFPPIATSPFATPVGDNVTAVSKVGGGSGSYAAGAMAVPVSLLFDHSIDVPFYDEDSKLDVVFSTDPPGSVMDSSGAITLSGNGIFAGGFLGGSAATVSLTGVIAPVP